jgi:AcrR family transcriptional regulator
MEQTHPTKRALIDAVIKLLEDKGPELITSDEVLHLSGVSRGSLYHHFVDFGDLIEAAQVRRFTRYIDESIEFLAQVALASRTRDDMRAGLAKVTRATQSADASDRRFERVMPFAAATKNPRLKHRLGQEQERLTQALMDLVADGQNRGYFSLEFEPRVIAVMIQAYTVGKIVDDVTEIHMDAESWDLMIDAVLDRVFGLDGISQNRNEQTA